MTVLISKESHSRGVVGYEITRGDAGQFLCKSLVMKGKSGQRRGIDLKKKEKK